MGVSIWLIEAANKNKLTDLFLVVKRLDQNKSKRNLHFHAIDSENHVVRNLWKKFEIIDWSVNEKVNKKTNVYFWDSTGQ